MHRKGQTDVNAVSNQTPKPCHITQTLQAQQGDTLKHQCNVGAEALNKMITEYSRAEFDAIFDCEVGGFLIATAAEADCEAEVAVYGAGSFDCNFNSRMPLVCTRLLLSLTRCHACDPMACILSLPLGYKPSVHSTMGDTAHGACILSFQLVYRSTL
jgi:hypothetical protein